ncbi:MAG TPA: ATP-grasp domain-containing protein [Gaiellaceae bacterium]|nr:ATP-grasp domain-containing protein [Gaiellaceae bacterium]
MAVVGWPQRTNVALVAAWRELGLPAALLAPEEARSVLEAGDVAVGRFDVLPTLNGVEPGLEVLDELEGRGVRVLNRAPALLGAHDKLQTARLLARAGVPHPRTRHHPPDSRRLELGPPVVVKPRFGSWGADVFRCRTREEIEQVLAEVASRPWYVEHGALLQELVPPVGFDLRLIVAAGTVVGAIERVPERGEWRTNVSLGAARRPVEPGEEARALAVAAAAAIGADLVGVDLLPVDGGYVVLELNGAVEFTGAYDLASLAGGVYESAARALGLLHAARPLTSAGARRCPPGPVGPPPPRPRAA